MINYHNENILGKKIFCRKRNELKILNKGIIHKYKYLQGMHASKSPPVDVNDKTVVNHEHIFLPYTDINYIAATMNIFSGENII